MLDIEFLRRDLTDLLFEEIITELVFVDIHELGDAAEHIGRQGILLSLPSSNKLDTVYILGDLIFRASNAPEYYLDRLKGKKHLLLGNHDKNWVSKVELSRYFESVSEMLKFSDGQHQLVACHYPMMSWPGGRNQQFNDKSKLLRYA